MKTLEIQSLNENQIISLNKSVGSLGNQVNGKIFKNRDRFTDKLTYVYVTREGILKYWGDALIAFYEGGKDVHYKQFDTAEELSEYIN